MSKRKYALNQGFFENIDSEEKAYWLGFLAADGYVHRERESITLSISSVDRGHLVKYKEAIGFTGPIFDYSVRTAKGHISYLSRVAIRSKRMIEDLSKFGVVQKKSFILPWPDDLLTAYRRDYMRGYFDGDGSFVVSLNRRKGRELLPNVTFSVVGNLSFIEGFQSFLMGELNLKKTKLNKRFNTSEIYEMNYSGRIQVHKILHWLYEDSKMFLDRKLKLAESFYGEILTKRCNGSCDKRPPITEERRRALSMEALRPERLAQFREMAKISHENRKGSHLSEERKSQISADWTPERRKKFSELMESRWKSGKYNFIRKKDK